MRVALLVLLLACCVDGGTRDTGDTGTDSADTDTADTDSGDTDSGDTATCPDADGDGYCDDVDNCDGPGAGDADNDGICDDVDNCDGPGADADSDGVCDGDDVCIGDNTTGDVDADGVCDGSDPCIGSAWCWDVSVTIDATPTGSGLDPLIGQTLSVRLGVGDDADWEFFGSVARTDPIVLSATGSDAAAQAALDALGGAPRITLISDGAMEIRWPVGCSATSASRLTLRTEATGWTFDAIAQTVALGEISLPAIVVLEHLTCASVSESATGGGMHVAYDGVGP